MHAGDRDDRAAAATVRRDSEDEQRGLDPRPASHPRHSIDLKAAERL